MFNAKRYRLKGRVIITIILISLLYVVSNQKVQRTNYSTLDIAEDNKQLILPDSTVIKAASYITHASIFIDSDDDFITYGFNGTGSWTNPYIIENYNITTTDSWGILIQEVSKSFIIQNCYIRASNYGILISNIFTNFSLNSNDCSDHSNSGIYAGCFSYTSKIENNICNNNLEGIFVTTYYGIISNNTCNDNTNHGIYLGTSGASTIVDNDCSNNNIGIYSLDDDSSDFINNLCTNNSIGLQVMSSLSSLISEHTLTNNSNYGLYLDSSDSNSIIKNLITNSNWGLYLSYSNNALIFENSIENSTCIFNMQFSFYCRIAQNSFINGASAAYAANSIRESSYNIITLNNYNENYGYAITLDDTAPHNIVHHNNFIGNNLGSNQSYDYGGNNTWFESSTNEGNYWSDWISGAYHIDGPSNSEDPYPFSNPIETFAADSDNDLMPDSWEVANGLNPFVDDSALDPDDDGLTNLQEFLRNTNPNDSDSDSDGLSDGDEVNVYFTNPTNSDTDDDLLPDGWEIANVLNPLQNDTYLDPDDDELQNILEFFYGTDPNDSDTDGDNLDDYAEIYSYHTDPLNSDSDSDGLADGDEINTYHTDPNDPDSDSDGLTDAQEIFSFFTNPIDNDTDDDGLIDGDEVNIYNTDPIDSDSDSDGYLDGWEVFAGTDPTDENSFPGYVDLDGDSMDDFWEMVHGLNTSIDDSAMDLDGDGLTNFEEYQNSTNPNVDDSDSDGLLDGEEVTVYLTDPNNSDSDGDGLSDGDEVNLYFTSPTDSDTDSDGITDSDEINIYSTDPTESDSDSDDLTDYQEIFITFTQPNNPDSDSDGLNDGEEVNTYLTDPNDSDSDSDGLSDYDEVITYLTNPNDEDSDGDNLNDNEELTIYLTDPNDNDSDDDNLDDGQEVMIYYTDPNSSDSDGDGLSDYEEVKQFLTNPNNADTDGDGLSDYDEVMTYGTDPNNTDTDNDGKDDRWEIENSKNPLVKNVYFTPAEIALYFVLIPITIIAAIFILYLIKRSKNKRSLKKIEKAKNMLKSILLQQREATKKHSEVFLGIANLLDVLSSTEKIENHLNTQTYLIDDLTSLFFDMNKLSKKEIEQFNGVLEEIVAHLSSTLYGSLIDITNLISKDNLQLYTKEITANLISNWTELEFNPLIASYEMLNSFLDFIKVFRNETLSKLNNLINSSISFTPEIIPLLNAKMEMIQEVSEDRKRILTRLTPLINNQEANTKRLEQIEKISKVYNSITLAKLSPLLDFEDKELLKIWLQAYSRKFPHKIEGEEIFFISEGEEIKEEVGTAIDDLLERFSDWEETGKGKKI